LEQQLIVQIANGISSALGFSIHPEHPPQFSYQQTQPISPREDVSNRTRYDNGKRGKNSANRIQQPNKSKK